MVFVVLPNIRQPPKFWQVIIMGFMFNPCIGLFLCSVIIWLHKIGMAVVRLSAVFVAAYSLETSLVVAELCLKHHYDAYVSSLMALF